MQVAQTGLGACTGHLQGPGHSSGAVGTIHSELVGAHCNAAVQVGKASLCAHTRQCQSALHSQVAICGSHNEPVGVDGDVAQSSKSAGDGCGTIGTINSELVGVHRNAAIQ